MAEIPELNSGIESTESARNMGTQKISVSENTTEKSDSFVIDMEAFSSANINKDSNSSSRITLQRSVSRKGWSDKKVNVPAAAFRDWDAIPAACSPSPRGCVAGTPEKLGPPMVGSSDPQVHHQITVTTTAAVKQVTGMARRNSFKRSSNLNLDPRKVLMFCATLSSIGSMVVIYLTLTVMIYNE